MGYDCGIHGDPPPASLGDEERAHIHTLDHPCRDTCSGWKQGYERGLSDGQPVGNHWVSRSMYEAEVEGLRTSRAELIAEREKVRRLRKDIDSISYLLEEATKALENSVAEAREDAFLETASAIQARDTRETIYNWLMKSIEFIKAARQGSK